MEKIASPQDLQAEIRRLLAHCQGPQRPSRQHLAAQLRSLADRVAGRDLYDEVEDFLYNHGSGKPTWDRGRGDLSGDEHLLMDWYQDPDKFSPEDTRQVERIFEKAKRKRGLRASRVAGRGDLVVLEEDDYDDLPDDEKRRWKGYYYKMTYETWDEEALEIGETDDKGWHVDKSENYDSLEELLQDAGYDASWLEWSDSSPGPRSWIISQEDENYSTGERTIYNLFIERSDGRPLGRDELKYISRKLRL